MRNAYQYILAVCGLLLVGCEKKEPEVYVDKIEAIHELPIAAYGMGRITATKGFSGAQNTLMATKAAQRIAERNVGDLADLGKVQFQTASGLVERTRSFLLTGADSRHVITRNDEVWAIAVASAPGEWFYHHYLSSLIRSEQDLRAGKQIDPIFLMAIRGPDKGLLDGISDDDLAGAQKQLDEMLKKRSAGKDDLEKIAVLLKLDRNSILQK